MITLRGPLVTKGSRGDDRALGGIKVLLGNPFSPITQVALKMTGDASVSGVLPFWTGVDTHFLTTSVRGWNLTALLDYPTTAVHPRSIEALSLD